MKGKINVLLVEENALLSLQYQMMLEDFGYTLVGTCQTVEEAQKVIAETAPDLLVSDVILNNKLIFEIGDVLHDLPTVFITSFSEEAIQEKAMQYPKAQFLIKPFHALSLKSAIERLQIDYIQGKKNFAPKGGIEILDKHRQKRLVPLEDICWIETDGNYSTINAVDKKYMLKISLRKIQEQLDKNFVQVHKSYIINQRFVNRLDLGQRLINVSGASIPLGWHFKKSFLETFDGDK